MLRNWVNFIIIFGFIVAAIPSQSHAAFMLHTNKEITQSTSAHDHKNCHHENHELKTKKISTHDDARSLSDKDCCDKTCKCMNGACHAAGAALGFYESYIVPPRVAKNLFLTIQEIASSDFLDRIKRPPRI